jgi:hypothetical protein
LPEHPDAAERIRMKLAAGALPTTELKRLMVLRGPGGPCAACDTAISADDNLVLVDCVGSTQLRMHSSCTAIWVQMRTPPHSGPL